MVAKIEQTNLKDRPLTEVTLYGNKPNNPQFVA
jgi:hypothetical protein